MSRKQFKILIYYLENPWKMQIWESSAHIQGLKTEWMKLLKEKTKDRNLGMPALKGGWKNKGRLRETKKK